MNDYTPAQLRRAARRKPFKPRITYRNGYWRVFVPETDSFCWSKEEDLRVKLALDFTKRMNPK